MGKSQKNCRLETECGDLTTTHWIKHYAVTTLHKTIHVLVIAVR